MCVEDIVINGEPQPAPPSLPPDPVDEICSGHPEACDPPDDSPPPSPDDGDGLAPSIAAPPAEQPQPTAPNIAAPVAGLAESTVAETITIDHPAVRTVLRRVQAVMLDAYVEHLALHTTEFRVAVAPSSKMGEPELICEETRDGGIVCVEWEIISCTGSICGDDDEENSTPGVAGRLASSALLSDAVGDITLDPEVWEHDGPGMSCMDLDCAIEFIQWCNALGGSSATEEGEGDGWEMNCDLDSQSF